MDEDLPPSPFIKKRKGIRPSGSSSSLRSLAASPTASTSNLSFAQDEDDDIGAPTVVRSIKKTTVGRLKDREGGTKPKSSRLSFGGGEEVSHFSCQQTACFGVFRTDTPTSHRRKKVINHLVLHQVMSHQDDSYERRALLLPSARISNRLLSHLQDLRHRLLRVQFTRKSI